MATPVVTPCSLQNPLQINVSELSCPPQFQDTIPIDFRINPLTGTPYTLGNTLHRVEGKEEDVGCTFTDVDYEEARKLFSDSFDENFELLGFARDGTAVVNEHAVASPNNADDGGNLSVSYHSGTPIAFEVDTPNVTPKMNPCNLSYLQFPDTTPDVFRVNTPIAGHQGVEEAVGWSLTNVEYEETRKLFDDSYNDSFEFLGFTTDGEKIVNEDKTASPNISSEPSVGLGDSLGGMGSDLEIAEGSTTDSANNVLKKLRLKNTNRVIIGTLNINSVVSKLEHLREVIGNYLDILTIQETKLDESVPTAQLLIDGYNEPYRLDRNRCGGGVLIYVREDIPSKPLDKHNFH